MSITKNRCSVAVVYRVRNGCKTVVGYLSNKDIENGLDITLDLQGFEIWSL